MKETWEWISFNSDRLKVPNGWIVRTQTQGGVAQSVSMIFVEDKEHSWELEQER